MYKKKIRIAGTVKESSVDGMGLRFVVFTQGCQHNCGGCHNKHTHDLNGGELVSVEGLLEDICKNPLLSGVTISGGEPLLQINNLIPLVEELKNKGKHIMMYTGYTYEELVKLSEKGVVGFENLKELLYYVDILVDGKFVESLKDNFLLYRGSSNQRLIDVKATLENDKVILWEEPKDLTDVMSDFNVVVHI